MFFYLNLSSCKDSVREANGLCISSRPLLGCSAASIVVGRLPSAWGPVGGPVGGDVHSAATNPGFSRNPLGGFYTQIR